MTLTARTPQRTSYVEVWGKETETLEQKLSRLNYFCIPLIVTLRRAQSGGEQGSRAEIADKRRLFRVQGRQRHTSVHNTTDITMPDLAN